ncbi:hypothetical protein DCO46_20735 [Flavobacterium sp. HTF]|nr:hypothetical protein DCO46_20735 [Flavobacterium sp. HTF]
MCFKAGAKLEILFVSCKKNLKNFETFFSSPFSLFSIQFINELSVFCGVQMYRAFSNLTSFFESFFENISQSKFLNPVSLSVNLCVVAGAKVPPLFTFTSLFFI